MKKPLPLTVLSLMLLSSSAALAQTPSPNSPVAPAGPAGDPSANPAVPPAAGTPPSAGFATPAAPDTMAPQDSLAPPPEAVPPDPMMAAPVPTIEDRLGTVEGRVEGLDESYAGTKSTVDKLNRIKFSGYVQGRFEHRGNSRDGINPMTGNAGTLNQFLVRRARLKLNYDGTNAEYVFQIDATGSGVALRDAEATFVDTWTPFGLRLTVGQFKWPFGYEILQSSADREMPERAAVIQALFPGERDRGLRLTGRYKWFRFAGALVNGNGTSGSAAAAPFQNNDNNTFKDFVGRVGGDFEWVVVGLSGYLGRAMTTTPASTTTSVFMDTNMDGIVQPGEVRQTSTTTPASYRYFSRKRLGADAQLYFDIPHLGGLALKGEFILAKDTHLAGAVAADPCRNVTSLGWIATAVQSVGDLVSVVARVDHYDPIRAKSLADSCTTTTAMVTQKTGSGDSVTSYGGGLVLHGSGNIKATFAYLHIVEQGVTVKNDIFTAQLQARF